MFAEAGLPDDLFPHHHHPQGSSLSHSFGLLQGEAPAEAVPLASAGAGTRRVALFRLAAAPIEGAPIVFLDEPESGPEPYRQRRLVAEIRSAIGKRHQASLTTHSPAILEALDSAEVTGLAPGAPPGPQQQAHRPRAMKGRRTSRTERSRAWLMKVSRPFITGQLTAHTVLSNCLHHGNGLCEDVQVAILTPGKDLPALCEVGILQAFLWL
jgi:hypothetical protein